MRRMGMCLLAAVLMTGCGGGDGDSEAAEESQAPAITAPPEGEGLTEQDVRDHLQLEKDGGLDYYRQDGADCEVAVVLAGASQVSTYVDAGDSVITNPGQTAGVKVVGVDDECYGQLGEALSDLE